MLKKSIILFLTLVLLISLVSAITSEPKNPTLEITSKTQLSISTETGPILVQLKPIGDLKNNLIINQKEFELPVNSQKTINLQLKTPIKSKEYLFINTLYLNPRDDLVRGDNTITLEVVSTNNKPLRLVLKEDTLTKETDIVQLGFNIIPLLVIALLVLFLYKKKWQKRK